MDKFQELLAEAAQLKESQLKKERKNYESLPSFLKAGLNFASKYQSLRRQEYLPQLHVSELIKDQANSLFREERYSEAHSGYEEALGVFRFITSKSYENMRDEDMDFHVYQPEGFYQQSYEAHLVAIYLNLCSCLTKLNRMEEALMAAEEALKIKQTPKAYYKKAQAYLQYINKDTEDVKLGFYYLNKAYCIEKDTAILGLMHEVKRQVDEEKKKEQKWFKFMFDQNSGRNSKGEAKERSQIQLPQKPTPVAPPANEFAFDDYISQVRNARRAESEQIAQLSPEQTETREIHKLQKTKQKLQKYVSMGQQWRAEYTIDFAVKNGSKIYSILQLYGFKEYLNEYKSLLAQFLELPPETSIDRKQEISGRFTEWIQKHPIKQIQTYLQRYQLQTKWIQEQRDIQVRSSHLSPPPIIIQTQEAPKRYTQIKMWTLYLLLGLATIAAFDFIRR